MKEEREEIEKGKKEKGNKMDFKEGGGKKKSLSWWRHKHTFLKHTKEFKKKRPSLFFAR